MSQVVIYEFTVSDGRKGNCTLDYTVFIGAWFVTTEHGTICARHCQEVMWYSYKLQPCIAVKK